MRNVKKNKRKSGKREEKKKEKRRGRYCLGIIGLLFCFLIMPQKVQGAQDFTEIQKVQKAQNFTEIQKVQGAQDFLEIQKAQEAEQVPGEKSGQKSENFTEEEMEETINGYLEELDFSEINAALKQQESTQAIDFRELVEKLIQGEEIEKGWLIQEILNLIFEEVDSFRGTLVQIVLLCFVFAILYNFADVFKNPAVTEISFYMVYMLLLVLLMQSFFILRDVSSQVITDMMVFLKVMIPAFTMSMAFSGQITTAAGFYDMTFLLIYGMEWMMGNLIIPAVQIYMVLELMNYLTEEELISRMTELLKSGIVWTMKVLFTMVIGINVVQNLLTPVIDTFKTGLITKTAGMLPGLGTSINAVTEIMVGSGIIIKNGIGLAAILVLLVLCGGPLIKVGVMTFLYKLLAAVIQPVSDKRMIGCISSAGESGRLLGKVVVTTTVMFLVTIAMITAATTAGY